LLAKLGTQEALSGAWQNNRAIALSKNSQIPARFFAPIASMLA
jgi:hypothetical protein